MILMSMPPYSVERIVELMEDQKYIADRSIATTIYLAFALRKPILVEGEAGCGKTDVGKVLAQMLDTELIRLQCYEGLDINTAVYEWDYPRQMLRIRLEQNGKLSKNELESMIFSERYLLKRPLLKAILGKGDKAPVLLIDEIDRSDEEFEAFLLEVLSDFQITIPEIGTIKAKHHPIVVLTSNRTREIGDALKRRCLYLFIDYPNFEKEYKIIKTKVPNLSDALTRQICSFMQTIRQMKLFKPPGTAESLDWACALVAMNEDDLTIKNVESMLGCIIKYKEDLQEIKGEKLATIIGEIKKKAALNLA